MMQLLAFFSAKLLIRALAAVLVAACGQAFAFTLPENFTDEPVITGLADPDGFDFSPDGRMFISERISGQLRVAKYDEDSDTWALNSQPFYTFNTPSPVRRSGGLRDITFDPDFSNNGFVYAFYMHGDTLDNRVVRIKVSSANPDIADTTFGEQLLLDLPFNDSQSSGSHNGGALEFGADGKLYITTGDGWEGTFAGEPVQSLESYTGKVFRINADGTIPTNNPFYQQASGNLRAIYALGLRNPYSMSKHPDTGALYINEARGSDKASVYLVEAGANYQHEGSNSGIGNNRGIWVDASQAGGELITGGAWLPETGVGSFPSEYNGRYFVALWGSNSSSTGRINTVASDSDTTVETFSTGLGLAGSNSIPVKPVITRFNQDGDLYYMLTTYTTTSGQIRRVRFTAQETVATPTFDPDGGSSLNAVNVTITSATPDAEIRFTTNNASPDTGSQLYSQPINIAASTIVRAKAFKTDFNPSSESSAVFIIGDQSGNQPPDVNAGPDTVRYVGETITLDGSATTDPDGDDDFLTDEQWVLLSGPQVEIADATEEIAFFTPLEPGQYRFQLSVSDGVASATDEVIHTVILAPRVQQGIQALYTFEEGGGTTIEDVSDAGQPLNLTINTPTTASIMPDGGLRISGSADIRSAVASKVIGACKASDEITIEAWVDTASLTQSGPGPVRIVSISSNTTNRNFTLGQENDRFDTRLRTSSTDNNGEPSLTVPASTVKLELTHIAYTRAPDAEPNNGAANIYVNGVRQVAGTVSGDLDNWDDNYALLFGNEATLDREWLGDIYLVGIYCRALSASETRQNFLAGLPPYVDQLDSDNDDLPDAIDNCPDDPNPGQQNLDGDQFGDICDADIDNDGVANAQDFNASNNKICADSDDDQCDDCSIGVDGFGVLTDAQPLNDGPDTDGDGLCDMGDLDDDGDGVNDGQDNCPSVANDEQTDSDGNGIGDACDVEICVPIVADNQAVSVICL